MHMKTKWKRILCVLSAAAVTAMSLPELPAVKAADPDPASLPDGEWTEYIDADGAVWEISNSEACLVTGPANVVRYEIPEKVLGLPVIEIQTDAFYENTALSYVTIPDTVFHIMDNAFYGCTSLQEIEIPGSVKRIESNAFSESGIRTLKLGEGLESISAEMCLNCENLTWVHIPESVTVIEQEAFRGCCSLRELVIPEGVTEIGDYAFAGCSGMKRIFFECVDFRYGDDVLASDLAGEEFNGTIWHVQGSKAKEIAENSEYYREEFSKIVNGVVGLKHIDWYTVLTYTEQLPPDVVIEEDMFGQPIDTIESFSFQDCVDEGDGFRGIQTLVLNCPDAIVGNYAFCNSSLRTS